MNDMKVNIIISNLLLFTFLACLGFSVAAEEKNKVDATKEIKNLKGSEEPIGPMDKPLIMVDGMPVSSRDYANFLQSHPTIVSRAANSEQGKAEALRELVSVYLLRKAMITEGLLKKTESSPSAKEIGEAYERLAERHFPIPPAPSEKEGYEYYQSHKNEFGIPTMVRLNQILFKIPTQGDAAVQDAAKQRAEKALKRLEAGEKFPDIATDLTEYPIGKVAGGDIGFVNPEEEEWMKSALKGLKIGQNTGVVKSPAGLVILQLTEVRQGLTSPYANVRDKVIKQMMDSEQKKLRDSYINSLAKEAKIEVVLPEIKGLFPRGMFP